MSTETLGEALAAFTASEIVRLREARLDALREQGPVVEDYFATCRRLLPVLVERHGDRVRIYLDDEGAIDLRWTDGARVTNIEIGPDGIEGYVFDSDTNEMVDTFVLTENGDRVALG